MSNLKLRDYFFIAYKYKHKNAETNIMWLYSKEKLHKQWQNLNTQKQIWA